MHDPSRSGPGPASTWAAPPHGVPIPATEQQAPGSLEADRAGRAPGADDVAWDHLVDKIVQTALVIVTAKLAAATAIVALWGIPVHSRLMWKVVPFVGLETSAAQFRTVAAWSTAATAVVASLWLLTHFLLRKQAHPIRTWAAAAAVPMAALLTFFEWFRRFDADHLIPTAWLVRILIFLAVSTVLFLGFIELPGQDGEPETSKEKRPVSLPTFTARS